jgi:hypothetical protein
MSIRKNKVVVLSLLALCLGIGATSQASQSVSLTWDPSPGADVAGYILRVGTNSGSYPNTIDVGPNILVTISGLADGASYYFIVTAYSASHIEGPSSPEIRVIAPTAPAPPLGPILTTISPSSAAPGAVVSIYGTNFGTVTSVKFNGLNATFQIVSAGLITATVPSTSGNVSLVVTSTGGSVTNTFSVVPIATPANDNLVNAQTLTSAAALIAANNTGATKQPGEPNHAGNAGGKSIWFQWTAPSNATWSVDLSASAFPALVGIYTGNSVSNLSVVASNRLAGGTLTSNFTFQSTSGTTYRIAVDGVNGAAGDAVVSLAPVLAPSAAYSNAFEVAEGFSTTLALAGQGGWLGTFTSGSGIRNNAFPGNGQQAYIGFLGTSLPGGTMSVYRPLSQYVNLAASPTVQFSVMMQMTNLLGLYHNTFGWAVRNTAGHEMFRITFNNTSHGINYALDNGVGAVPTGASFDNTTIYTLRISMDFSRNVWSATLNGANLIGNVPISATGATLNLGDIGATAEYINPSNPGFDAMLFDNFTVIAAPSSAPTILYAPGSQNVAVGSDVMLGVVAAGAAPLSYQWYYNADLMPQETNASVELNNVVTNQSGTYSVIVWNSNGSAGAAAAVSVTNAPPGAVFTGPVRVINGSSFLNLSVVPGNTYRLQASTNLVNWATLGSFYASGSNALCSDPVAWQFDRRYYRLIAP